MATATLMLIPALAYADVPVATISGPVSVAEGQTGGAVYTVTLEGGTGSANIVFDYTVTGTVSQADYTDDATVDGKLTLEESGGTTPATGTITLQITDDGIDEVPETLIVTLTKVTTEAGMVAIGSPNSVTTTVLPAATNTVSFADTSVSAAEDAPLVFTANLTTTVDVAVDYDITPGTASHTDYDSASGTFTILAAQNNGSFTITPVDDDLAEGDEITVNNTSMYVETFTANLRLVSPPANVALGIATATGTINDDDPIAATVTANQTTIVEGSDATFTVDLGNAGSEDVVVTYNTDPITTDTTADADSDDFEAPEGTLTIPAGQTMGTITITTSPDDLFEVVEELRVTLDAADSGAGMVGLADPNNPATTGIGDPESTVLVSVEDATTTEGEDAILVVRLSAKVAGVVTVPFGVGGGTAASTDYTDPAVDVTIPAGETTGTIVISTTEDQIAEDTETFTVTLEELTSPPAGVRLGDETATVTIRDDNPLTVTVVSDGPVREGEEATFTVNLNGGMGSMPVTVDYTVGGTATKGTDYVDPDEKTLVINPVGSLDLTSGTITIQTRQDPEENETLVVTLTNPRTDAGRVTLGTPHTARSTLVAQGTVIITVADDPVVEGESASFTVSVTGVGIGVAKLRYETAPGTATVADYTAASDTRNINIEASPTNDPITVAVTNDSLAEDEETFTLKLSLENPPDNVVLGRTSAKATISDDDDDDLSVSVASEEGSVEEGSDANFTVTLSGTSTADVVVKYAVAGTEAGGADAAEKEDYEVPGDSVTIPAGTNTATITIPIVADDLLEPNETLQVTLMSPTTAKGAFATDAVTGDPATTVIIPQAQGAVTASLATTAVTVTEGGKASFPVELSGKVAQDLTFTYTLAPVAGTDYTTATPQEVEIKEGETRAVIEVNTTPDVVAENTETFTLTLVLPPPADRPAGLVLGAAEATGTITDNDPINVTVEGPDRVVAAGSADYRFRLTGGTTANDTAAITVAYSTNGTPPSGTATIATSQSVSSPVSSVTAGASGSLVVRVTEVTTDAGRVASGVGRTKSTQIRPATTTLVSIADSANVDEGGNASFEVSSSGATASGTVTVSFQVSAGSASASDFRTPNERTLTLDTNGDGTITVPIENDDVAEGAETFRVTLSSPRSTVNTDRVELGTTSAMATINPSDALTAEVRSQNTTVLEGESATFVVDLGGTSSSSVEIDYTVAGSGDPAADEDDFSPAKGKLTIPAGRSTGTIQVEALDDDILEPAETLQVTLTGAAPANVVTVDASNNTATTTIGANGSTVTASLATTAVTVTEGGKASFPVELSGKVAQDLTFTYTLAPVAGTDYTTATPQEVEIKEGETRAVIEVNTTPDVVAENTETFTLTLVLPPPADRPAGLVLGAAEATGTITDNDPINVTVEGPDRVVAAGSADYRFRLTGGTTANDTAAITVAYSTNGTPPSGTATIATSQSVSSPVSSVTAGASGSLVVRVTEVTTDAGRVASGVGRTKSTQIRPATTTLVSIADSANVDEGGNASFEVSSSGATASGTVTVSFQVSAGSASASDFRTPNERTLTLDTNGDGTITVPIENDDVAEGAETFRVTLSSPRSTVNTDRVELGTTSAMATINPSDALTAEVRSQNTTVLEGESATFVVDLGGTSSSSVEIDYTVAGSGDPAADEDDFSPAKGKLTIPAGRSTGTIQVEALDDDILEPAETLQVTLTGAAPANVVTVDPSNNTATTSIGASDSPARVSVADVTVDEGETAMVEVKLSKMVSSSVTVSYSLANVAPTSGDDYGHTPAALVFMPGETAKTIEIQTTQDSLAEDEEKFTVTLGTPTVTPALTGVSLGRNVATVTITDDAVTVSLSGDGEVNEGEAAEYTVSVTGFTGEDDIIVSYSVDGETATPQDYSPSSGTLTLNAEQTSQTFTIQIAEDDGVDLRESFVVSISAETSEGDPVRRDGPITTMIVDDGTVEISVAADPEIVPESREEATFTVTLSGTVGDEPVILDYQTADRTATAPADYTAANGTLTIAAGDSSAIVTVAVNDDGLEERTDETFDLTISAAALPDGVEIETATATVTVTDHTLEASVSAPATVNEGQSIAFTVSLTPTGQNRSGFAVDYDLGGTAVAPGDYTGASSGTLTIPAGQDSGVITITTNSDGMLDPNETLSVTLSNPRTLDGGLAALGSPATATVTIVDQQTVTWSVEDINFPESQDAVFTVMFDQGGLVQDAVTLTYETIPGGTATPGDDYTAVSNGQVMVPGGSPSATFTVQVTDDSIGEPAETFMVRLTLSSDAPDGVGPPSGTAQATIEDDDLALLPIAPVTVAEGNEATIALALDSMTTEPVTLSYQTVDGSATFRDDYLILLGTTPIPPSGAVPVPVGSQGGAVTVRAVDDSLAESSETFTVRVMLSNGGSPQEATVTITDNDTLRVSVTGPKTVAEGDIARFTVRVGGAESTASVNVNYSLGGTAKAPADYSAPSPTMVSIPAGEETATIAIQTKADKVLEADETLVVTLDSVATANGAARVGSPKSATTAIQDAGYHSINRVNRTLLPGVVRASTASALEAIGWRMAEGAGGDAAAGADLAGLTGLYRALQANEYALQDGSYDLAKVLGGSSFLVPLSAHGDGDGDGGVGFAVWGGGDFRGIGGGAEDAVKWDGSVWSARVGADVRFVDSLLTGMVVSYASGALDYTDATPRDDREGTYGTWLASVHPFVGWTTPDFGLWASGGFGRGGLTLDDSEEDPQETYITQWSVGGGGSVTLVSGDWLVAGGTTALKLKADGFLASATAEESENKLLQELSVSANQVRAAIEASHAQHFAGGGSLKPTLEIGGRYDGGDGETGAGLEVGGGLTYADAGSGLTLGAAVRALVLRENYGEWGLSGLLQWDPDAAGHGLMMSVRPTIGVTASGISGLWEHGTLELLTDGQPGGRVEAEIGYGLPAFGMTGVLTPFAGASLTDAGAYSLSVGGRLELGPAFGLMLEAERSESADPSAGAEHDVTLEGSFRW